jgi:coenzyme F420-reducing hydrogenase alpha subunit
MHKDEEDIHLENLSKVEGHGSLDIKIRDGKVTHAKLKVTESKRFYTQAIRGKFALSLPLMTARICGTCSIAHSTCCTEAVEKALGYTPSDQTMLLRKLSLYGMMIRDHALHLYVFCLPDLFGKDSVLDFDESQNDLVRKAFAVKGAGNNLSKAISGRAVHATFSEVGKFSHLPSKDDVQRILAELKSVRNYAIEFMELFYERDFKLEHKPNFISLLTDDYSFYTGELGDSKGERLDSARYWDYVNRKVIPYSEAVGYEFEGGEYMVGALARMNLNRANLNKETKKDASKFIGEFPSNNIYRNNLAQAIEILHCIDSSIAILESSEFKEERNEPVAIREGEGIGIIEAPRGILCYRIKVDKTGKVVDGNIVVPTQQNQICMERTVVRVVEENIDKNRHLIEHEIEKMVRAYDPCMSCASHFLKVNWK